MKAIKLTAIIIIFAVSAGVLFTKGFFYALDKKYSGVSNSLINTSGYIKLLNLEIKNHFFKGQISDKSEIPDFYMEVMKDQVRYGYELEMMKDVFMLYENYFKNKKISYDKFSHELEKISICHMTLSTYKDFESDTILEAASVMHERYRYVDGADYYMVPTVGESTRKVDDCSQYFKGEA